MAALWWAGLGFAPEDAEQNADVNEAITNYLVDYCPVHQELQFGRYSVHSHHVLNACVAADIFNEFGDRIGFGIWATSEESARAFLPAVRILLGMMRVIGEPSAYTLHFTEQAA